MKSNHADRFRPVGTPRIIENAYSEDQHRRLLSVVREHGPWPLILAHHFKTPEEVIATTTGELPEGFVPTWDMFLSPVFRGYLARRGVCLFPEIEDCYYNTRFLDLVRDYWRARYAEPETMLFNIQGPSPGGGAPHIDGTIFRGMTMDDTPLWLLNTMAKSGLFRRWQAKKAQVIAWYYQGKIGGGFNYWPDGPKGNYQQIPAPMWGRAVVVENEMMYHGAQSCGAADLRRPAGLEISSTFGGSVEDPSAWQVVTGNRVIQQVPAEEMRFLVHWGAQIYLDYEELKVSLDHTDDISIEQAVGILLSDLRERGHAIADPSEPLTDRAFVRLLSQVYDLGTPAHVPPEPEKTSLVA